MPNAKPITVGQQFKVWFDWSLRNASCCGWRLANSGKEDPFFTACVTHDENFILHHQGNSTKTLAEVNQIFLADCLAIANAQKTWIGRTHLRILAYAYYAIVLLVSPKIWNANNTGLYAS